MDPTPFYRQELPHEGTHSFHANCKKIYNLPVQKMQRNQRRGKELSVSRRSKRHLPPCRMWRMTEIWLLSCPTSWRRAKVPWIRERPGTGDHHKVTTKKDLVVRGRRALWPILSLANHSSLPGSCCRVKARGIASWPKFHFSWLLMAVTVTDGKPNLGTAAHFSCFFAGESKWPQGYEIPRRRQKKSVL